MFLSVFIGVYRWQKSFSAFDFSGSNTGAMEGWLPTRFHEHGHRPAGNQIRAFKRKALEPPMNTDEHRLKADQEMHSGKAIRSL